MKVSSGSENISAKHALQGYLQKVRVAGTLLMYCSCMQVTSHTRAVNDA